MNELWHSLFGLYGKTSKNYELTAIVLVILFCVCYYAGSKPMFIILMRSCFQVSQPYFISNEIQTMFKGCL